MEHPETRFCVVDGDHVAYQVFGRGPVDLIYTSGLAGQVDLRWDWPPCRDFLLALAKFARVVMFDRRGMGASDAPSRPLSWEDWSLDLLGVLDAVESRACVPIGIGDAGPPALLFAAQHPERVRGLVLYHSWARLGRAEGYEVGPSNDEIDALFEAIAATWGRTGSLWSSDARDEDEQRWQLRNQRAAASPGAIRHHLKIARHVDARHVLPLIACPVLLLERTTRGPDTFSMGYLRDHLAHPVSRTVSGRAGPIFHDSDEIVASIAEFATGTRLRHQTSRRLVSVAFVDIVGSTAVAGSMGDAQWRRVLIRLDELIRSAAGDVRGRLVKSTGDGALLTFDGPAAAIRAVHSAIAAAGEELGITARAGIHMGEVEVLEADIGGVAVHLAARVCDAAGPGEVLVSRTVQELVIGSELRFGSPRSLKLKGFEDEWTVFPSLHGASPGAAG